MQPGHKGGFYFPPRSQETFETLAAENVNRDSPALISGAASVSRSVDGVVLDVTVPSPPTLLRKVSHLLLLTLLLGLYRRRRRRWSPTSTTTSLSNSTSATSTSCLTRWSWNPQCLRRRVAGSCPHVRIFYHGNAILCTLTHVVAKPVGRWWQGPTPAKLMPAPSSSILPSWEGVLPSLLVLRCVHSQTPSLHLRTMMTTSSSPSSSVQVLTRTSTTSIALPNTQLTATMSAHPLTSVTWTRLGAALSSQTAPSTSSPLFWRRVHLRSSLLQRSSGRCRPFCFGGLGKTVESDEGRPGRVWKRLWVSSD